MLTKLLLAATIAVTTIVNGSKLTIHDDQGPNPNQICTDVKQCDASGNCEVVEQVCEDI